MYRTNISVPDHLRQAMLEVSKERNVNWSRIACKAFEKAIADVRNGVFVDDKDLDLRIRVLEVAVDRMERALKISGAGQGKEG